MSCCGCGDGCSLPCGSSGARRLAARSSFNGRGRNWPRCRVRCVWGRGFSGRFSMAAGAAAAALAFLNQESRARAGGVGGLRVPAPVTMDSFFFGCELSGHTRSFTFKVEEEEDTEHMLALNMLCLTEGAKDECNVVEVVARDHDNQEIAVPVANLRLSCQPMLSLDDFQLQPPVTFRLKSGSGPVRITGRHRIVCVNNDLSEESEDDESEEGEVKLCGILPAKKHRGRP